MPSVDVQVHGAGWAGRAIARGLADAGVAVRLVDPAVPEASARGGAGGPTAGASSAGASGADPYVLSAPGGAERLSPTSPRAAAQPPPAAPLPVAGGPSQGRSDRWCPGASGAALGVAMPTHPEHPHRFEAGVGTRAAADIVAFVRDGFDWLPGLARVGVDWRVSEREEGEVAPALAAAARIGLAARPTPFGYHLDDGGFVDLAALIASLAFPVFPDAVAAEVDVYATGPVVLDPWLADKITPVRWQACRFDGPALAVPVVSQHATVLWAGALDAAGARWATPHMEIGETTPVPDARVTAMLEKLTREGFSDAGALRSTRAAIVGESCDGLPIVGPVPGRPRAVVCAGFGVAGLAYALPCARAVIDGLLGRPSDGVPAPLRVTRFA